MLKQIMDWEKLAEARIQEWRARPAAERGSAPVAPVAPLELQLLAEVLELRALADAGPEAERRRLAQRAHDAETRLMVLLESSGRPLAARRIAELLSGGAAPKP